MENEIYGRHGDLVIRQESAPSGVEYKPLTGPLVVAGRDTAPHAISAFEGVLYAQRGATQYVYFETPKELTHQGRHQTVTLEPGSYSFESLTEMDGELARAVED